MPLAVLDVGSNTVRLVAGSAHRRWALRLAERITGAGELADDAIDELASAVGEARAVAQRAECDELCAFATSAVRDAANATQVLERVRRETGVQLSLLSGEEEARLIFLAARRWVGDRARCVLVLDIGGGSLEIASGRADEPDAALSLPLGAARLTRECPRDQLADHVRAVLTPAIGRVPGAPDVVVGTSKTFRMLAGLARPRAEQSLTAAGLHGVIDLISGMSVAQLCRLDGVSPDRARQLFAGALVAEAAMCAFDVQQLRLCPWALREGVLLSRGHQPELRRAKSRLEAT